MLTGFAILERELGAIDYARHRAEARLRDRGADGAAARQELAELERRRTLVLARLDELHEEWSDRHPLQGP